jgi:hypothetical protein
MVCFQTKNPNFGKFWRILQWKIFVYVMTIWSILRPCKYLIAISYILWSLGIFSLFWYIVPRKIWQPWTALAQRAAINFNFSDDKLQRRRIWGLWAICPKKVCRTKFAQTKFAEQSLPNKVCRTKFAEQSLPEQSLPEQSLPKQNLPKQSLPKQSLPKQSLPNKVCPNKVCRTKFARTKFARTKFAQTKFA